MEAYRCTNCQAESMTKTTFCPKCRHRTFEQFQAPTEGSVYSYTIIRIAAPEFMEYAPYSVVLVELTKALRVTAFVQEAVEIGDRVKFKEEKDQTFIFEKVS